jgi:hypothetical protein
VDAAAVAAAAAAAAAAGEADAASVGAEGRENTSQREAGVKMALSRSVRSAREHVPVLSKADRREWLLTKGSWC